MLLLLLTYINLQYIVLYHLLYTTMTSFLWVLLKFIFYLTFIVNTKEIYLFTIIFMCYGAAQIKNS